MQTLLLILISAFSFQPSAFAQSIAWLATATKASSASWNPLDEASLVGWYKETGHTNTSDALCSNADPLKAWRDNSGHNNHLTNFMAGTTMTTNIDNAQNGLACVRFDGSNDELRADDIYTSYVSGNDTPMIWAMTYRNAKNASAGIWFCGKNWGGSGYFVRAEIDGSNRYYCTRNDSSVEKNIFVDWPVDTTNWHSVVWVCTGTTATFFHDGAPIAPADQDVNVGTLTSGNDAFYVGTDFNVFYGGDMGEVLIFNSSSVNPTNVYNYLKGRWATP